MRGDKFQRQVEGFVFFFLCVEAVCSLIELQKYVLPLNIYLKLFCACMELQSLEMSLRYSEGGEVINSRDI